MFASGQEYSIAGTRASTQVTEVMVDAKRHKSVERFSSSNSVMAKYFLLINFYDLTYADFVGWKFCRGAIL